VLHGREHQALQNRAQVKCAGNVAIDANQKFEKAACFVADLALT
jgi:hypothetical protein